MKYQFRNLKSVGACIPDHGIMVAIATLTSSCDINALLSGIFTLQFCAFIASSNKWTCMQIVILQKDSCFSIILNFQSFSRHVQSTNRVTCVKIRYLVFFILPLIFY